ncbi:MAG: DEAD/DEAH box helicase, partial [Desulfovibrionaceae bacterium]|nr:DEAD/DEAH box helicase [Desulfovibrionaceae bacterium]
TLQEMGFLKRTNSKWFLNSERVIDFLLNSYPTLISTYSVFGEKRFHKYKMCTNIPTVHADITTKESTFNVDLYVKYDTENISMEAIWKEWVAGRRYIQLKDGSFVSLPEEWLKKASSILELSGTSQTSSLQTEFLHHEIGVLEALFEEKTIVQADSFWEKLRSTLHNFHSIPPIPSPQGLQASLRSYQEFGVSYLAFLSRYGFSGILADEMGLGKTVQTLAFIQHEIEQGDTRPNLIVVPTSVLYNWEREAEKFLPNTRRLVIYGIGRDELFSRIGESQIVFTTYVLLRRDLDILKEFDFNVMVLDEAQHIKNPNTITTRAVRGINAKMRLCLSGTPIENNLFELWSLFDFLMPNFLGTRSSFQKNVVKPIRDGNTEVLEYFKKKVSPFILRRMKTDVAQDLPEKIETTTFCSLGDEQRDLYYALAKQLKKQVLHDVDKKGIGRAQISILDALLKLRQICCHPKLLDLNMPGVQVQNIPSSKFETFKELVTTIIDSNHRVLVFSQFIQMLHIMRDWFIRERIPYCYLDGTTKDRIHQVDIFNTTPSIPVFLISLKAGGVGLNLTSADYVIHYDPWWNPAVESQATDRVHRIGQTKQVFSYKLICQNTVEEKILLLQEQKKDIADSIIPSASLWQSITRGDIEMLFEPY